MLALVADLTLRGSIVFALVGLLDLALTSRMQARSRRAWWWVSALAFVFPWRWPVLPPVIGAVVRELSEGATSALQPFIGYRDGGNAPAATCHDPAFLLSLVWAAGVVISLGLVVVQTMRTSWEWKRHRLCTDKALLDLLEDCKATAGITAPIGLVVSETAPVPALLGWLRPRILLPAALVSELSPAHLKAVMLHELAHFRALDTPLHWLFTLITALHWFNPVAYFSARRWLRFRELAADEAALTWMNTDERADYGDALLAALRHAHAFTLPHGVLALGESARNLKHRIVMLSLIPSLARRTTLGLIVTASLFVALTLQTVRANPENPAKEAAATATESWLKLIDSGRYGESWETASADFRKALTEAQWQAALQQVRAPLGKLVERKLVTAKYETVLPTPTGPQKGEFVIALYNSVFEGMPAAREMLTFSKEADGTWKASGYFIKPQ